MRIAHLSDLHFGRTDPVLIDALLAAVAEAAPDLVVISGDFTQRARIGQFAQARAFLDRLGRPVLAVPGNHDTPLDNLFVRLLWPWRRYRRAICRDLQPQVQDAQVILVGVNSVNRWAWQQGRMPKGAIRRAAAAFADAGTRLRLVVLHHPLELVPGDSRPVMREAGAALAGFAAAGADILLSGHLHRTHIAPFRAAPGMLFVQAGTLSTRTQGEANSFNILDLAGDRVAISAVQVTAEGHFRPASNGVFVKSRAGWQRSGE